VNIHVHPSTSTYIVVQFESWPFEELFDQKDIMVCDEHHTLRYNLYGSKYMNDPNNKVFQDMMAEIKRTPSPKIKKIQKDEENKGISASVQAINKLVNRDTTIETLEVVVNKLQQKNRELQEELNISKELLKGHHTVKWDE
jgi:hypothetical protein